MPCPRQIQHICVHVHITATYMEHFVMLTQSLTQPISKKHSPLFELKYFPWDCAYVWCQDKHPSHCALPGKYWICTCPGAMETHISTIANAFIFVIVWTDTNTFLFHPCECHVVPDFLVSLITTHIHTHHHSRRDIADFRLCGRLEIRNICALLWSVPVTAIGIITPFRLIGLRTKKKQTVDHILNERRRKALASTRSQRRLFIDWDPSNYTIYSGRRAWTLSTRRCACTPH